VRDTKCRLWWLERATVYKTGATSTKLTSRLYSCRRDACFV